MNVDEQGIAEVVVDVPPVNALTVAGWFELADTITAAGRGSETRVVVLRAEGKGFNAGVDIKEMQNTEGFDALIGANKGCFAAFAAVYDCPVPVIAAVQRLLRRRRRRPGRQRRHRSSPATTPTSACPRSTAARSARRRTWPAWCPQHKMRAMVYTGATATAAELHALRLGAARSCRATSCATPRSRSRRASRRSRRR